MDQFLRPRWLEVMADFGVDPVAAAELWDLLASHHAEPHRRYHTLEHIGEVVAAADDLQVSPAGVVAAFWHDAIYDPTASGGANEAASAELASAVCRGAGVAADVVAEVDRLIRLTAGHQPAADDVDGGRLCDTDLSILGADPVRYARYTRDVRAEYAHVDDAAWRTGRAALLEGFLRRDRIFHSEPGRERWEDQARMNLQHEFESLR